MSNSKHSSLIGFVHPDLQDLHKKEVENREYCEKIDKLYDHRYSVKCVHAAKPERKFMPTAHEIAERNPILRALLKEMQK